MAKRNASANKGSQIHEPGAEALEAAQAERAGSDFEWHSGRIIRMGSYDATGRSVTIAWEEGGVTSQQGGTSDEQWEIFKLAFQTTGRVAVLSDRHGDEWMYDYRFLEAVR